MSNLELTGTFGIGFICVIVGCANYTVMKPVQKFPIHGILSIRVNQTDLNTINMHIM